LIRGTYIGSLFNCKNILTSQIHIFTHIIFCIHYLDFLTRVTAPLHPPIATVLLNAVMLSPRKCAGTHTNFSPLKYWRNPCVSKFGMYNEMLGWAVIGQILI
jgi:hypothetical protein